MLSGFAAAGVAAAAPPRPRFEAKLADGKRVEGKALVEWHTNGSAPRLDAHKLLEAGKPFVWLRDRHLRPPAHVGPRLVMHTGDVMPGVVTGFVSDPSDSRPVLNDRFLVRSPIELTPQAQAVSPMLEILAQFVKRIVWTESSQPLYHPNTAFLRDGRRVLFRAVRFSRESARLRTDDGVRTIGFSDLAELHLPATPSWDAHLDELALLTPDGQSRLLQIETTDGLIATTSMARTQAYRRGSPTEFEKWIHGVQPAWCRQMLWTPVKNIWMRRSYAAHEVPLGRIYPKQVVSRSPLNGSAHPWRINRNRDGQPLRSGGQSFGWGFGGHARWELSFDLHPLVRRLRCQLALDQIAANGGCLQGRINLDSSSGPKLAESPVMVGQRAPHNFDLAIAPDMAARTLVLTVDPLNKSAPAGADPLDIRDACDWLEPLALLDPALTQQELTRRSIGFVRAWDDWTMTTTPPKLEGSPPKADLRWKSYWDASTPSPGRFTRGLVVNKRPFRLSREITFRSGRRLWLAITAYRPISEKEEVWFEARLNGVPIGRHKAPLREGARRDLEPVVFALPPWTKAATGSALLEIIQEPTKSETPVVWVGATVVDQPPRLQAILDEQGPVQLKQEDGSAATRDSLAFSGDSSLRLRPGQPYRLDFDPPLVLKDSTEYNTLRYFRFAYRKQGGGRLGVTFHHANEDQRPTRYHLGPSPYVYDRATGVQAGNLPERWMTLMRDVVGDFGAMELAGISFLAPDGGDVLLDQCHLAQHPNAFAPLALQRRGDTPHQQRWDTFQKQMTDHVSNAILHLKTPSGEVFTGVLISAQGDLLVSRQCHQRLNGATGKATLPDGRTFDAKPSGLARDFACGMLKIESKTPLHYIAISNLASFSDGDLVVQATATEAKQRELKGNRAVFQTDRRLWLGEPPTRPSSPAHSPGASAWLDQHGALIGFEAKSPLHDSVVIRCKDLPPLLDKLRKGEKLGAWAAGDHPALGARWKLLPHGLAIASLDANSPLSKAGLQVGDEVLKLAARDVLSISDLIEEACARQPGERLAIRFRRKTEIKEVALQFAP